jgi:membrane protein implicated in regulation of membrane protease activity
MRSFVVYTAARLGLLLGVYGLIWLAIGRSVTWDSISALYTAILAMVVSSLIAFVALRRLRDRLAADVASRADAGQARREQPGQDPQGVDQLGESGVTKDRDQR